MPRGTTSCWTCRLRHKKCDESLPVCNVCAGLEITCYSGQNTPDWLDGGEKQQAVAEQLKAEVRLSAKRRRARRVLQRIVGDEHELPSDLFAMVPSSTMSMDVPLRPLSEQSSGIEEISQPTRSVLDNGHRPAFSSNTRSPEPDQLETPVQDTDSTLPKLPTELEQSLIMCYLDYIFPALFPFYKPAVLEGARNWLLVLTLANKSFSHAATSISSYFLAVVPVQHRPERVQCVPRVEEELHNQICIAMRKAQQDIKEVSEHGLYDNLITSARLLDSIVHLLCLEVSLGFSENWVMHLDAGILLFKQILDHTPDETTQCSKWTTVCERMRSLAFPDMKNPPRFPSWTVDQAAFRFFSAILIVHDVVSSSSLEQAPRLQAYHQDFLAAEDSLREDPDRNCHLRLEDFIGCQNWAMVLIGKVTALDSWKKKMHKKGALSNLDLVKRGTAIEQGFREGLIRLSNTQPQVRDHRPLWLANLKAAQDEAEAIILATQIWAHAGLLYLHVVLSGWQQFNTEICDLVSASITLMKELATSIRLHTLAWPLCVTACLAKEEQEESLREIFGLMGDLANFGATRVAQEIAEAVWGRRNSVGDSWDIAACLNVLDRKVILG